MGNQTAKSDKQEGRANKTDTGVSDKRAEMIPDATYLGPQFCKSCWFERRGLIACSDHYLCLNCLTLLLSVSERCPICKLPLPQRARLSSVPSAPPQPPPYSP
nr:Z protein [Mafiga mammarenavirus]